MIDLQKRLNELKEEDWFSSESVFFTKVCMNWNNQGNSFNTPPIMTGREIVEVTTFSQQGREIYILEENLLGERFLYEKDLLPKKKLISFELLK